MRYFAHKVWKMAEGDWLAETLPWGRMGMAATLLPEAPSASTADVFTSTRGCACNILNVHGLAIAFTRPSFYSDMEQLFDAEAVWREIIAPFVSSMSVAVPVIEALDLHVFRSGMYKDSFYWRPSAVEYAASGCKSIDELLSLLRTCASTADLMSKLAESGTADGAVCAAGEEANEASPPHPSPKLGVCPEALLPCHLLEKDFSVWSLLRRIDKGW